MDEKLKNPIFRGKAESHRNATFHFYPELCNVLKVLRSSKAGYIKRTTFESHVCKGLNKSFRTLPTT